MVTLGSKVSKYYLHWVIWIPSVTPSRMIIAVQRGGGGGGISMVENKKSMFFILKEPQVNDNVVAELS